MLFSDAAAAAAFCLFSTSCHLSSFLLFFSTATLPSTTHTPALEMCRNGRYTASLGASLPLSEDAKSRDWERNGESCRVSTTTDFKLMGSTKGFTAYTADGATDHPNMYCGNGLPSGHAATEYTGNDDAAACAAKCKAVNCTCYDFNAGGVSSESRCLDVRCSMFGCSMFGCLDVGCCRVPFLPFLPTSAHPSLADLILLGYSVCAVVASSSLAGCTVP